MSLIEKDYQEKKFIKNLTIIHKVKIFNSNLNRLKSLIKTPNVLLHKLSDLIISFIPNSRLKGYRRLYSDEMISELISSKKSLIRWGDGETFLAFGQDISFQKYDSSLSLYLNEILSNYSIESKYYLAIPLTPLLMNPIKLAFTGYFVFWHKTRVLFKKKAFPKNVTLMDAFIFRPLSSVDFEAIERLWINNRVILVSGSVDSLSKFSNIYNDIMLGTVLIPSNNAFSSFEFIIDSILELVNKTNKTSVRVLISAGPTAKVLAYLLSESGLICYDIGHYLKWKMNFENPEGVL